MPKKPPARIPRRHATSLTLAASALLFFVAAPAASAAVDGAGYDSIVVTAEPESVSVGDTITVTAVATGLVDAYAYDLDLSFDPALIAFDSDSEITPAGGFGSAAADAGTLSVVGTRLGTSPGLTGTQTLVTLTFTALAPGTTEIALSSGRLVDAEGTAAEIDTTSEALSAAIEITALDGSGAASGST